MKFANLTQTSSLSLPADSYIYKLSPVLGSLAAASSDDSLRLIDPTTLQETSVLKKVHECVTSLETISDGSNSLLTAGRDAAIRRWDLRSGTVAAEFQNERKAPLLSLASRAFNVAAGTELTDSHAVVALWDQRRTKNPILEYTESHNDDITELQFHPTNPHSLLSGSTDGLLNIYTTTFASEEDALGQVENHGSSISHAGFLSSVQFFALSHDEMFSIYAVGSDERDGVGPAHLPTKTVFGDLRPGLECEYVVDVIPRCAGVEEAVVGAGSHSKEYLDLVPLRSTTGQWAFDPSRATRLEGAHGEEIVRSIYLDNPTQTVFTGGEDGLIKAWRTPDVDGGQGAEREAEGQVERPSKKKMRKKDRANGDEGKDRFNPY